MSRITTITTLLFTSIAFASGCELLEEEPPPEDSGTGDDTGDDTGDPQPQTASVRFVNVNPDVGATMKVDSDGDGTVDAEVTLYFTQGSDWMEVPAGTGTVTIEDESGNVLAEVADFPFGNDQKFSIAPTNQPGVWIKEYLADGIEGDNTRVNLRNAYQGGTVDAWVGYWQDDGYYTQDYTFDYGPNGEWTQDLAYHAAAVQLEHLYADQDQLIVDWNIAALVQVDPGSVMDAYTLLAGDCSYLSSTCEPWLIAHQANGETFTVELSHGWAAIDNDADGYVEGEDCDDTNAAVNPGATEICDGLDNDCDGMLGAENTYELNSSAAYGSNAGSYAHMSFVVTPDHDVTVDTFEAYVGGSGTTGVALYTRSDSNDPWTLVDSQSSTIGGLNWYGGTGLGWELTGGTEYMFTYGLTGGYNYTLVTTVTQPDWGTYNGFANVAAETLSPSELTANPNPGASIGFRVLTDC